MACELHFRKKNNSPKGFELVNGDLSFYSENKQIGLLYPTTIADKK